MCGKDLLKGLKSALSAGSPPLVRERRLQASVTLCKAGITPARAGKTEMIRLAPRLDEDHPRSCGKDQ